MEVDDILLNTLPQPFGRKLAYAADPQDPSDVGKRSLQLVEWLIHHFALVGLASRLAASDVPQALQDAVMDAGSKPSTGKWLAILRAALNSWPEGSRVLGTDPRANRGDLEKCRLLFSAAIPDFRSTKVSVFEALAHLVTLRNDESHKKLTSERLAALGAKLYDAVEELLRVMTGLTSRQLVIVELVEIKRSGWQVKLVSMMGNRSVRSAKSVHVPAGTPVVSHSVCLWDGASEFVDLWPFLRAQKQCLLWLNGFERRGEPEYVGIDDGEEPSGEDDSSAALRARLPFLFGGVTIPTLPKEPARSTPGPSATPVVEPEARPEPVLAVAPSAAPLTATLAGERAQAVVPSESAIAFAWGEDALVGLLPLLRPVARAAGGTITVDEDDTTRLRLAFPHAVWKTRDGNRSIGFFVEPAGGPHSAGFSLGRLGWGKWRSPLDGAVEVASLADPILSPLLCGCGDADRGVHGVLPASDRATLTTAAVAVAPTVVRRLTAIVQDAWDSLPKWAQLVSSERDPGPSAAVLRKATVDDANSDPWFLWSLGTIQYYEERAGDARETFGRLVAREPSCALGFLGLARITYKDQGLRQAARLTAALQYFEQYRERDGRVEVEQDLELMAKAAIWTGGANRQRAVELWDELADRSPDWPEVGCWQAQANSMNGNDAKALEILEGLLQNGRNPTRASDLLATIYRNRGHYDDAVVALRRGAKPDGTLPSRLTASLERIEKWRAEGRRTARYGGTETDAGSQE